MKRETLGKILILPFLATVTLGILLNIIVSFIEHPIRLTISMTMSIMTTIGLYLIFIKHD